MRDETLKTSEAAVVAAVSLRDLHRALDENILPSKLLRAAARERGFSPWSCVFVSFYFSAAGRLTSDERKSIIKDAVDLNAISWTTRLDEFRRSLRFRREYLTVDLGGFADETAERLRRLKEAKDMIEVRDDILAGSTPVIRGTRIPVYDVAAALKSSQPGDVAEDYPSLTVRQIELAALYAEAVPVRGRPRRAHTEQPAATIRKPRAIAPR